MTTGGSPQSTPVNVATNRLTAGTFDAGGNLTDLTLGGETYQYTYDPLNVMKYLVKLSVLHGASLSPRGLGRLEDGCSAADTHTRSGSADPRTAKRYGFEVTEAGDSIILYFSTLP